MTQLRVVFAGTPEFSVPPLQALIDANYSVVAVYTQPDRPAGRGRKLQASPVKQLALNSQLPVLQPQSLKSQAQVQQLAALKPDIMIVVAYGLLLPETILAIPTLGCINIHASLLPKWRGAAPIQRAILAGDKQSGVSIMQMDKGLDTGAIFSTISCDIGFKDTAQDLHDRLSQLGSKALLQVLPQIADQSIKAVPQNHDLATYAHKLSKQEAQLDWSLSAIELYNQIRGFYPWPIAYSEYQGNVLRIWQAELLTDSHSPTDSGQAQVGEIIQAGKTGLDIMTGQGIIRLKKIQLPGKQAMNASDFANAYATKGIILGAE